MVETFNDGELAGEGLVCVRGGRVVFRGLSFVLPPGGALLLIGPNGSGKSSLLRMLAGLLRPWRGAVRWAGEPLDSDQLHGRVRYVGHADALKPTLTVAENLGFWARLHGGEDVGPALERVGLGELAELPARFLSAGQRRRLALARLLVAPVPVWLLDEPTVALDRDAIVTLEALIDAHRAAGGRVVASTHAVFRLPCAATLDLDAFAPVQPLAEEDAA